MTASAAFQAFMAQQRDAHPTVKVEYISVGGITTDISAYYKAGANFEQSRERAPDQIQAGDFDIVLTNADNKFSEYDSSSLIYNAQYHGAKIKVSLGFVLSDGTTEYVTQGIGFIDEIQTSKTTSEVTFRCRDFIRRILDQKLHETPVGETPTAGTSNIGNGIISNVATLPFKTKNETWTLTCTLNGADAVATFSVVGSTSGNVGTATSGTEFSTGAGAGGVKFTISAGSTNWSGGDTFTFTTKQYPEWTAKNAAKIIWSVLTGYDYDSNTAENFAAIVLDLDRTQSDSNTDIDYNTFVTAIANLNQIGGYNLTGYAAYDEGAVDFLQNLILLFLGSLYTGSDGRIKLTTYMPAFNSATPTAFSDALKIRRLGYSRTVDEVINYVVVNYKKKDLWEFSDINVDYTGSYVASDAASIVKYKRLSTGFGVRWYSAGGVHVSNFASRLIGKFNEPPVNLDFDTGLDALLVNIGDIVSVTDTKYALSAIQGEISKITKHFDDNPMTIGLRVRRDASLTLLWGFLGTSASTGDGLSPQAGNYDVATASDKLFAYLSQTGGTSPDYRMF